MVLGIAVALPIYKLLGPDKKFVAFALFMGVAMSITAFPVLARILVERRMLKRPVGALDAGLRRDRRRHRLVPDRARHGDRGRRHVRRRRRDDRRWRSAFCLVMGARRAAAARPRVDRLRRGRAACPAAGSAAIFAGVLLSAYVTEEIGIAVIFGAFIMGMVMPRNARLTEDVTRRIEDFVVVAAAAAVLRLHRPEDEHRPARPARAVVITLALIAVAIVGKLVRRHDRRARRRVRLARLGGHRDADEHPRADRADRAQPRAREGRRSPTRCSRCS